MAAENDLELRELLMSLAEVGRPRLSKRASGCWHAALEFPAPKGVTAEVGSSFDHTSPESALR